MKYTVNQKPFYRLPVRFNWVVTIPKTAVCRNVSALDRVDSHSTNNKMAVAIYKFIQEQPNAMRWQEKCFESETTLLTVASPTGQLLPKENPVYLPWAQQWKVLSLTRRPSAFSCMHFVQPACNFACDRTKS